MKERTFKNVMKLVVLAIIMTVIMAPAKKVEAAQLTIPGTNITIDIPDGTTTYKYEYSYTYNTSYKFKFTVNGQTKYYILDEKGNLVETDKNWKPLNSKSDTKTKKTVKNGWKKTKAGKVYYKNGKKLTGLQVIGKYTYYFNKKGIMIKNKFVKIKGKTYAFDKKGHMVKGASYTAKVKGKKVTYYFDTDGKAIWKAI